MNCNKTVFIEDFKFFNITSKIIFTIYRTLAKLDTINKTKNYAFVC